VYEETKELQPEQLYFFVSKTELALLVLDTRILYLDVAFAKICFVIH
jgi:hypothetical protein